MQPLMEAGLDSLGAVELRDTLSAKFEVETSATFIFDHPTVSALAAYLDKHCVPQQPVSLPVPANASAAEAAAAIAEAVAELQAIVQGMLGRSVPPDQVNQASQQQWMADADADLLCTAATGSRPMQNVKEHIALLMQATVRQTDYREVKPQYVGMAPQCRGGCVQ